MSLALANYGARPLTAVSGSRRTVSFRPTTEAQIYTSRNKIRLHVSGVDFIDPANFQLNFKLNVAATRTQTNAPADDGIVLPQSAESYIDYITVRVGGSIIDDVRQYSVVESALHSMLQSNESVSSLGYICTGQTPNDSQRLIKFSGTSLAAHQMNDAYYSIDLSGLALFGSNPNMIPVRYLAARQPIEIEITLKDVKDCFTLIKTVPNNTVPPPDPPTDPSWDLTALSYTWSDIYITADALDMDEVSLLWDERILREPMVYPVESITHYTSTLLASQTRFQHTFGHPGEDLRTVLVTFTCEGIKNLASATTPVAASDMLWFPPFLQESSLRVGVRNFPETDRMRFVWKGSGVDASNFASNGVMAFREAIKAMGRSADHRNGFFLNPDSWAKNKMPSATAGQYWSFAADQDYRTTFGLVFNLDSNPSETTPDLAGTGVSTLSATTHNLTLDLIFSEARAAAYDKTAADTARMGGNYTVDIFCLTKENLLIFSDRVEREIKLIIPPSQ
jgi:hypothetical protein